MAKASRVIVLAEDDRQQRLVRRYLYRLGYEIKEIRFADLPNGRGSGEQWVRARYANEVREYRSRSARAKTLLIAIDADTETVERRRSQLDELLTTPRTGAEMIVHLIPKRNVETWVLCLIGEIVTEEMDYRQRKLDEQIKPAANALFDWSRIAAKIPASCLPPLSVAISELRRLEKN